MAQRASRNYEVGFTDGLSHVLDVLSDVVTMNGLGILIYHHQPERKAQPPDDATLASLGTLYDVRMSLELALLAVPVEGVSRFALALGVDVRHWPRGIPRLFPRGFASRLDVRSEPEERVKWQFHSRLFVKNANKSYIVIKLFLSVDLLHGVDLIRDYGEVRLILAPELHWSFEVERRYLIRRGEGDRA